MRDAHCDRRPGYTLVEVLVSMGAAAILMTGLASTLLLATAALDPDFDDRDRAEQGEVLSVLQSDLAQAKYFTERTSTSVAFVVPDRDGDGEDESIRYAWSGTPGDPLTVAYNGGTTATLLGDVQVFDLQFATESFAPPTLTAHVGFPHVYANQQTSTHDVQVATRFTVLDPVTISGIAAYTGGHHNKDFRVAVYDDSGGEPDTLLAESAAERTASSMDWTTLTVPDTFLAPGDYWLAVAFEHKNQCYQYTSGGGELRTKSNDAVKNGFLATWGASDSTETGRLSIYAVHDTN